MSDASKLSAASLRKAAAIRQQIEKLEAEYQKLVKSAKSAKSARLAKAPPTDGPKPRRRKMSAEGRARIIAAQKRRWAKAKAKRAKSPKKG